MSTPGAVSAGVPLDPVQQPVRSILNDPALERSLISDGFIVVDALGPDEVASVSQLVNRLYPGDRTGFHSSLMSMDLEYRRTVFEQISPCFEAIARTLFHEYEPFAASLTLKWPGEDSALEAHQDYTMVDESRFRSLNIWCPLIDTTPHNGALSVLRGSHRVLDHLRCGPANPEWFAMEATSVAHDEMETLSLKAGQAVVFDHGLLHGSAANLSGHARLAVTVAYRPAEAQLHHFHVPDLSGDKVDVYDVDADFFQTMKIGASPQGTPSRQVRYRGTPRRKEEILDTCAELFESDGLGGREMPRTFKDDALEERFGREGFVVVDMFDADEVRELQDKVDEMFRGDPSGFHATNMLPSADYRREVWAGLRPMLEPRSAELLADHEACTTALMIKYPDEDSGFISHQDWSLVDEGRYRSVNVWVPLVDVDEANGALRVLPGSHSLLSAVRCSPAPPARHQPPGWRVPVDALRPLPMRAGQAVIFDHAILHGSEPNRSGVVRPAVTIAMKPITAPLIHWYVPDLERDDMEQYEIDPDYLLDFELGHAPKYPQVASGTYVPDDLAPEEIIARSMPAEREPGSITSRQAPTSEPMPLQPGAAGLPTHQPASSRSLVAVMRRAKESIERLRRPSYVEGPTPKT